MKAGRFIYLPPGAGQPKRARRRKTTGWIQVNMSAREVLRMKAVADCCDMRFRTFLELGVRSYYYELKRGIEEELAQNVKEEDVMKWSKAERRDFGRWRREMNRALGGMAERVGRDN